MDFPSSKRFCSPAGQIQPQHAWLRTAAAHPQQLQPGGGEGRNPPTWRGRRPESIRGIHSHKRSLSLRTVCLAGEPPASSKCLKSLMNRDNSLQGLLKIPYKFGLF